MAHEVPAAHRRRFGDGPTLEELSPVEALGVQFDRQICQPRLAGTLIQPVERDERLEPAELPPVEERLAVDVPVDQAQAALDRAGDALVARRIVHLHQHLEGEKQRPDVEGGLLGGVDEGLARPQPAVLVLMG